jgi:signal transduction histidine kinase
MSELPGLLVQHVCGALLRDRRPAYLVMDSAGRLVADGGDLATYGLEVIEPGRPVWEQVPFLRGFAVAAGCGGVVPFVQVAEGRYADIHFFREAETEWIVLLDMTSEASRQEAIQQAHNERQLRQQRDGTRPRAPVGPEPRLSDLYRALDVVALQRTSDQTFRFLTDPPPWAVRAFPAIATALPTSVRLRDLSPFLEHFESDAGDHWESGRGGQLRSGPWQEVGETGEELHLEASALSIRDAALLVIERLEPGGAQSSVLLQKARDLRVDQLRMRRDMDLKEILLHCIVHDLSGPAAAILGCLESLVDENLSPPTRHLVELGVREAERQIARISQILQEVGADQHGADASDDAGLAPNVEACAADVVGAIGQAFATKNVSLFLHSLLKRDRRVVGDRAHLERILFNLLENALRYTPTGTAVVVELRDEGDQVRVSVDDQGPGVAEDVVPLLFRRFAGGHQRPTGKAGLGLYFCRITVERWRGAIGWEPRPGGGARFWFRLPYDATA